MLTRVGVAGWAAWSVLAIAMLTSTSFASLQRRTSICGSEGLANPRAWVFRLVPLGQTCAGEATVAEAILHIAATTFAALAASVGIAAVVILLVRGWTTALPPVAAWLLWGVLVGIVLTAIAWAARAASGIPYSETGGESLSIALALSVAFGVGLAATAVTGVFVTAMRSSHN